MRPKPKSLNDSFMLTTAPRTSMTVFLSCWVWASRLSICLPMLLQRFAFGGNVNVDHAADLVVIDLGGRVDLVDVRDRAEGDVRRWSCRRFQALLASTAAWRASCMGP